MSDLFSDLINEPGFSATELTAAINELDTIPGRAGVLAFEGVGEGIATTTAAIEIKGEALTLIPTTSRGAPAPKEVPDKASLISFSVPHIPLEDTVAADSVQGVREFGTGNQLRTVGSQVHTQMTKMAHRHDLTLENLRLGALCGVIKDADSSTLVDLFDAFGILNTDGFAAPEQFDFELDDATTDVRLKCQALARHVQRHAKMPGASKGLVRAFCGDNFFDKLLSHPNVKGVYLGTDAAKAALGDNYVTGIFEFGGVFFENYLGSDDNSTVAVDPDEARFFLTGVPGLYAEYYAPANFIEAANTKGLPRYAKLAPDKRFNQYVELHTQQNPLPVCLRPKTLVKGIA